MPHEAGHTLGAQNLMSGFDPSTYANMGTTYESFIRNQFGANPLRQAFGFNQFAPAQLQYLAAPAMASGTGLNLAGADVANPFNQFLQTYDPMSGAQLANLANTVRSALSGEADLSNVRQQLLRERFGTGEGAQERQAGLAMQPIIQSIAPALRGTVSNVLQNIYADYLSGGAADRPGFLEFAATGMGGTSPSLWSQFGVSPSA